MDVLFLGGPRHRERHPVPDPPPYRVMVVPDLRMSVDVLSAGAVDDVFPDLPEPVGYDLRRLPSGDEWVYVAPDYPECDRRPCAVPDCVAYARTTFTAPFGGRLAGRVWGPDAQIRLCPKHGMDVSRAQHVTDRDQLPDWLRADARPSALAEFDQAQDVLTDMDFGRYDWRLPALREERGRG